MMHAQGVGMEHERYRALLMVRVNELVCDRVLTPLM
jgi:hypothetical protein